MLVALAPSTLPSSFNPLTLDSTTGTLSRYITHPAQWCHKIPSSISYEEAALMEPLSVALHGVERANIRLGDPVLIWCASSCLCSVL